MTINSFNYYEQVKSIDFSNAPEALVKTRAFVNTVTGNGTSWAKYEGNPAIKKTIDLYFDRLAQFAQQQPKAASDKPEEKWEYKPPKAIVIDSKTFSNKKDEEKKGYTKADVLKMLTPNIKNFFPYHQKEVIVNNILKGEEAEHFVKILKEFDERISKMPATYDTEKIKSADKIVTLHYFSPSADWYIVERDKGDGDDGGKQFQAWGYADLGHGDGGEWGYIPIAEMLELKQVELDLYFKPQKFSAVKNGRYSDTNDTEIVDPAPSNEADFPKKKEKKPKKSKSKKIQSSVPKPQKQGNIERVDEEHRIIKRFVALHGKTKTDDDILSFLNYIQRAILERRVTKAGKYAKEITHIQNEMVNVYNDLLKGKSKTTTLTLSPGELAHYGKIAEAQKPMTAIALLKRYVSLNGKRVTKEKAEELIDAIETASQKGKIEHKYINQIADALKNLKAYINGRKAGSALVISEASLSGINECLGRPKSALMRDRKYTSQQEHEKAYTPKRVSKVRRYKKKSNGIGCPDGIIFITDTRRMPTGILFEKTNWTREAAQAWATKHGIHSKPEESNSFWKFSFLPDKKKVKKGLSGGASLFIPLAISAIAHGINHMILDSDIEEKFHAFKERIIGSEKKDNLSGMVSSEDLMNMSFDTIGLQGKWQQLMGDPAPGFTVLTYGKPGTGKSTLMLQFARHLAEHHGKTLFVSAEDALPSIKLKMVKHGISGHPNLTIVDQLPGNFNAFDFIFIDSVTVLKIDGEAINEMKKKNPGKSMVFVAQATKAGNYSGSSDLAHEVDIVICVEPEKAFTEKSRYGSGEIILRPQAVPA